MRIARMNFLFFCSLFFSSLAYAGDDCRPVDLRPKLGPPMNQGDSGYCFAHAAASLIQAKLGVRVSPMQLAANFILANPSELTGVSNPEVNALLTPAMVRFWRTDRGSEPKHFTSAKILGDEGLIDTGGEEAPTLLIANYLGLCLESRLPTGEDVYSSYMHDIRAYHERRVRQGIPQEELSGPIGEVLEPKARAKAWSFRHWVAGRCGRTFAPTQPILPVSFRLASSLKEFRAFQAIDAFTVGLQRGGIMNAINDALDTGRPVSVGYALGDLIPEQASSVREVDHASVVAARKRMGGKCYYFMHNSFGYDTSDYSSRFKGRTESGGVWFLPAEIPSLYGAVWLD